MKKLLLLGVIAALLGVIGCKGQPGYVGEFGVELSADQKKQMESGKAEIAKLPEAQRKAAEKMMNEVMGAMDKLVLTLKADGTWSMAGVPGEDTVSGTYTAEGTTLTLTPAKDTKGDATPKKIEYNEKDNTLTLADKGQSMTFKKK